MTFTPTPEQQAIIDFPSNHEGHLLVEALAGAAKTSTLVMLMNAIRKPTLCVAFNKKIATELQERIPAHAQAKTLNALGFSVLRQQVKRVKLNARKRRDLLRAELDALPGHEREEFDQNFLDILKAIEFGARAGYVPTGTHPKAKRILDDDGFRGQIPQSLEWDP
jgi:superfamily I DNA/RNA helicase